MGETSRVETTKKMSIYKLPPDCITQILSLTSLQELCSLCQVSKMLKDDSESDGVWKKFLPLNYKDLIPEEVLKQIRLKDLFHKLCTGYVLLKGENRTMSIEKNTGGKTFMIGSREVVFSDDDNFVFWRWVADNTSRFGEVAELVRGLGFYISCRVDTRILSPQTTYMAYLVLKYREIKDLSEFYPKSSSNIKFIEHEDSTSSRRIYLKVYGTHSPLNSDSLEPMREDFFRAFMSSADYVRSDLRFPVDRDNGWLEVDLGEFYNNQGENGVIEVSIGENAGLGWKRGLIVEGIELRPKLNMNTN